MKVVIVGAGKGGRGLSRRLVASGTAVRVVGARALSQRPTALRGDLVLLCVRDPEVAALGRLLAERSLVGRTCVVLHSAGAWGPEVLAPLSGVCAGVGQAHPLASFPDAVAPSLNAALLLIDGNAVARRRASWLARALGMRARRYPDLDRTGYHAAAALVANGGAALCGQGIELLVRAGMPRPEAARALGRLLGTVAEHVARLGLPGALTGPVRRGDWAAVARQRRHVARELPGARALHRELLRLQVPFSRALGDADPADLARLARTLGGR
jgi:predicted short-subunit dehydrogenase-like oxidoreductase (DUF2520 family)